MCRSRDTTEQGSVATTTVVHLHKGEPTDRLGLSFAPDEDVPKGMIVIKALNPQGAASQSGLLLEDRVLSINGAPLSSSLEAAKMLRDSTGDIWMAVERGLGAPEAQGGADEEGEGEPLDTARQDIADLDFLQERLKQHEGNLLQRQEETAAELERLMRACEPPPMPTDAEMLDQDKVAEYMMQMGAYSAKQQMQLEDHGALVEENQVISRQLSEVAQIKRWMQDTAQWLQGEIECYEEGHEEGDAPPMLSEEDIEYMELVDEQLYELLDGGEEGEEGEEAEAGAETGTEAREQATGAEDERAAEPAPPPEPPKQAEEPEVAQPVSAMVRRSNSFSRRKGVKPTTAAEEGTEEKAKAAAVARSSSFGRRGGANAEGAAKTAGEEPSKSGVRRANSFSRRKNLGNDVMDSDRRERLIAQRLQRARKSSLTSLSSDDGDEVGAQIHPI